MEEKLSQTPVYMPIPVDYVKPTRFNMIFKGANMLEKLLKPFLLFLSNFATKLPQTIEDFEIFYKDLVSLFSLPEGNQTKHAFASMLMQLPQTTVKYPKAYFAKCLQKAIVNQAAFRVLEKIRDEEKAAKDGQSADSSAPPLHTT